MTETSLKRFLPLILIVLTIVLFYLFGGHRYLTLNDLLMCNLALKQWVNHHFILAAVIFIGIYALFVVLAFPAIFILSIVAGCLFLQPLSTIYVVLGATLGSLLVFWATRTAFGDYFKGKANSWLAKVEKDFEQHTLSYLLFLRLNPLFPFWLVSAASAVFNVRLWTFIWTTFVGLTPSTFVFTQMGVGLTAMLMKEESMTLGSIFNMHMNMALIGLMILSLIPLVIRR